VFVVLDVLSDTLRDAVLSDERFFIDHPCLTRKLPDIRSGERPLRISIITDKKLKPHIEPEEVWLYAHHDFDEALVVRHNVPD
jgi:hypothetical protein